MTSAGRSLIMSQLMRTPATSSTSSSSFSLPVRFAWLANPLAATSPLDTPDMCKIMSIAFVAVSRFGRIPADSVMDSPLMPRSSSTCFSTLNGVPCTPVPNFADSGPMCIHFSYTFV